MGIAAALLPGRVWLLARSCRLLSRHRPTFLMEKISAAFSPSPAPNGSSGVKLTMKDGLSEN